MQKLIPLLLTPALLASLLTACDTADPEDATETPKNNYNFTDSDITEPYPADFSSYESIVKTYYALARLYINYEDEKAVNGTYAAMFNIPNADAQEKFNDLSYSVLCVYPRLFDRENKESYKQLGYTVKDLNSDGIDELILRCKNGNVITLYTMHNGNPIQLGYFWERCSCRIDPDGLLRINGSNGADKSTTQIYRIASGGSGLTLLFEGGTDGVDPDTKQTLYYVLENGEKKHMTKEEYASLKNSLSYRTPNESWEDPAHLPFVPLFDNSYVPEYTPSTDKG